MADRISYQPTDGLCYDPADPRYWDREGLQKEITRVFEVCHGCRMCFKYCDSFPRLFEAIDERCDGDVHRVGAEDTDRVMQACFQCKLCEVQCPYSPRDGHEFQVDFPKLVHRYRAIEFEARGPSLRDRALGDPDRAGFLARLSLGLADRLRTVKAYRVFLEKTLGIHRDKKLPPFARQRFEGWARRALPKASEPGGEAVLFPTCYVEHNEPEIARDTLYVLERNGVDCRVVPGLRCCGMPAWERGDLETLRENARTNLDRLMPFVERGAKVLVVNPTCSMMMRREHPELLEGADRARAQRLAEAVEMPSGYLWSIRDEARFSTECRSKPTGPLAYHAPCHLRAQAQGFKGRDLLRKVTGARQRTVMECCGHNGTYAMTVEGFEPSQRIGKKAFDQMRGHEAETWITDCPLAALQLEQHAGRKPLHPMTALARAYRGEPFDQPSAAVGEPTSEGGAA